jgi:hypothetical protein
MFLILFLAAPLFFMIIALLPDYLLLLPAVQRSYETGEDFVRSIRGIPVVIIIANLIAIALFFGKYFGYILLPRDT